MYFTDQNIMQRGEGPHETELWRSWNAEMNIPTDRAQKVDGKNGVIWLFIMFTPWVMVIKMSKMVHFCIFCWCQQKISHSLDKIFTCIWKNLFSSLRKCYGLLDSELPFAGYQPLKIQSFIISTLNILQMITLKPMNHTISWKNPKRSFRCTF